MSIAIRSEEDNAYRYNASLIGFTRVRECVAEKDAAISQPNPPTPPKPMINILPDDQLPIFARGEFHALKQIGGLCLVMISHSNDELSMHQIVRQIRIMQDAENPEGLPEYFNRRVSTGFDRMVKSHELTQK